MCHAFSSLRAFTLSSSAFYLQNDLRLGWSLGSLSVGNLSAPIKGVSENCRIT